MRFVLLAIATGLAAQAGVVRGVVYEHSSGLPLARTDVRLQPVPRPGAQIVPLQTRTASSGAFIFLNVPDGLYLLTANREPYFPAGYGQRRPDGHGTPIEVTKDTDLFAELRMYRKGAITGRVLDENGIGMQDVPVIAYRVRLPLRAAGRAISDDRGVYRIYGLDPEKYWVRTVAHILDDGEGRLPTFGREGRDLSESHIHAVRLDEDTPDADVRPFPGRLFRLRGHIQCEPSPIPILVTLSSEIGRKTLHTTCMQPYTFEGLAPAMYEIFAQKQIPDGDSGFMEIQLDHNSDNGDMPIGPPARVEFVVRRAGGSTDRTPVKIVGHRQDLSESGEDQEIPMRATLAPGHWELNAIAPEGTYIQSMTNAASLRRAQSNVVPPDDWFDLFFDSRGSSLVTITISDQTAKMDGTVTKDGQSVPGAPVFLWPVAESARRSLHGFRETITDTDGHFGFTGLPPGDYRLLATFDMTMIDEEKLDQAHAITVHVDAGSAPQAELALWIAP